MRVAVLNDIHANLPALEAVLEDVRAESVDRIVVGGDVIPGPMPRETLARLLDLEVPVDFIYGNGEVVVLERMAGRDAAIVPEQHRPIVRWTAEQLPDYHSVLGGWPKTVRLDVAGLGSVLFCHATPRDENEIFTRLTPEERVLPMFEGVNEDIVVCGHTHMQFDRMVGTVRVINAGSVGMPFGVPGADWLLLGPGVELRHTDYDLSAAAAKIRATAYPEAEDIALNYVLQPPSEQTMLDLYARASMT